jgi:ribonuclease E/ribonuclease G
MSGRLMLVESDSAGLRAALLVDGVLKALEIDRAAHPTRVGATVTAKIDRTVTGLGIILKLPDGSEALLSDNKAQMRDGEMLLVQISSTSRGEKLPGARRSISLTGPSLIHLPFESGVSFSRRLDAMPEQRKALEARLAGSPGGWIVRRTALNIAPSDLDAEIAELGAAGARLRVGEGALPAPDAFARLAADHAVPAPHCIFVSGLAGERAVERWCMAFMPSLLPRIARHEGRVPSLFDLHDLDEAIAMLAHSRVDLAGGGSLVIERTEALTAIDVNAGTEVNAVSVNLAAAMEIARQLMLRHIGGIVVIDFISMSKLRDRERVTAALALALAEDPAQTHILPMSAFGLVEMTRERRGPGVEFRQ